MSSEGKGSNKYCLGSVVFRDRGISWYWGSSLPQEGRNGCSGASDYRTEAERGTEDE